MVKTWDRDQLMIFAIKNFSCDFFCMELNLTSVFKEKLEETR